MSRCDISLDPKATHYCKHCGLTMKAKAELECPVLDGDFCEAKKRTMRPTAKKKAVRKPSPDDSQASLDVMLDSIKRDASQFFRMGLMRAKKTLPNGAKVTVTIAMPAKKGPRA